MNKNYNILIFGFFLSSLHLFAGTAAVSADTILPKPKINIEEFIADQIQYPQEALEKGIEGTVYVKCIVLENGSIDTNSIRVVKGLKKGGAGLNNEAMRVVRLMAENAFVPPRINGEPVKVWVKIPIRFQIIDSETEGKENRDGKKE